MPPPASRVAGGPPSMSLSSDPTAQRLDAVHALHGETMGTSWSVKVVESAGVDLHRLHAVIQAQLDRVVAQMSTWEPGSDISRFNQADAGSEVRVPAEFLQVLDCALQTARESGGCFDPTLGTLVDAWGFGPAQGAGRAPDQATLDGLRGSLGWQRIEVLRDPARLVQPGGLRLDFSAIAKGYAVDLVAAQLRRMGVDAALTEVGGELHGYGRKPDGQPWQVLVETWPEADADPEDACVLSLHDLAVATSGDRWHVFEQDGVRYSHTLDPRTGKPVSHAPGAVTVIAGDAMHADAWATALTVMGADEALRFAQRHGIAARIVCRGSAGPAVTMTDAFKAHLQA